jgi:hypothetical protein
LIWPLINRQTEQPRQKVLNLGGQAMRIPDKRALLRSVRAAVSPSGVGAGTYGAVLFSVIASGVLVAGAAWHPAFAAGKGGHPDELIASSSVQAAVEPDRTRRADFAQEQASSDARYLANWVVDSGDNQGLPFIIVDKASARVFVLQADGRLLAAAPALLGLAIGDDAVPGLGARTLSSIRPDERTTPAGRFVASLDRNIRGGDILWVDYEGALSLHPVITSNPKENRAGRLATPTPLDNRISFGCINVPPDFFRHFVSRVFTGTFGVVYVLPETRPLGQVFASYDVEERARLAALGKGLTGSLLPQGGGDLTKR